MQQGSFDDTFKRLTGFSPLSWQRRFFEDHLAIGETPSVVDLPTGLGKTSVMALWLIARAWGHAVPRRLVYVVDRRVVVDQATEVAETLAAKAEEVLGIKDLAISTLRGRHIDNRRWLEDPSAPAIVVGTVDMVGSRLLLSGYGVSRGMRPYQAGLLGYDTLIVLDEAHLCPPFEALLHRVSSGDDLRGEADAVKHLPPPLRMMSLSATGRSENAFALDDQDRKDPTIAARLSAAKQIVITACETPAELEKELIQRAARLVVDAGGRIVVFCTGREMAQKVLDGLRKDLKGRCDRVIALTGARRMHEREAVARHLQAAGFIGADGTPDGAPSVLVATAAGEVGLDLDADHAVMDLVAAERMVQRLGRVNRRARIGHLALIEVIDAPCTKAEREATRARRSAARHFLEELPQSAGGYEASTAAIAATRLRVPGLWQAAITPAPLHPPLTRATLDAWAMTSLDSHAGRPDIAPWLRGWPEEDEEPELSVAWRRWLPWGPGAPKPDAAAVTRFFEALPVQMAELLEAPRSLILDVLLKRAKAAELPDDAPALVMLDPWDARSSCLNVGDLRGVARNKLERDLRGTLVVSAFLGGLDRDGLLAASASGLVDLTAGRKDATHWPGTLDAGWDETTQSDLGLQALEENEGVPDGWAVSDRISIPEGDDEKTRILVVCVRRTSTKGLGDPGDVGDPAVRRRAQALDAHLMEVELEALHLAGELGLLPGMAQVLGLSGALHDLGKNRSLWQRAMGAPRDKVYAKTTGKGANPSLLRIGGITYRHEFGSLADAEDDPRLTALAPEMRDLALHLVAAHHGHSRPGIAALDPREDLSLAVSRARAVDVALRFARMQRRWGPWGLAWWEAVLRAADQRASRRLDETEEKA